MSLPFEHIHIIRAHDIYIYLNIYIFIRAHDDVSGVSISQTSALWLILGFTFPGYRSSKYSWVSLCKYAVNLSGGQPQMYWCLCCTGESK